MFFPIFHEPKVGYVVAGLPILGAVDFIAHLPFEARDFFGFLSAFEVEPPPGFLLGME
jgi:hypothetical protein